MARVNSSAIVFFRTIDFLYLYQHPSFFSSYIISHNKQESIVKMADTAASASASASTSEGITLEGLKAHSTREDLWLLINGKVYDVTKFMDEVRSHSYSLGFAM